MHKIAAGLALLMLNVRALAAVQSKAVEYRPKIRVLHGMADGFTNPDAARSGIANLKYDAHADRRSWARMQAFFAEIL